MGDGHRAFVRCDGAIRSGPHLWGGQEHHPAAACEVHSSVPRPGYCLVPDSPAVAASREWLAFAEAVAKDSGTPALRSSIVVVTRVARWLIAPRRAGITTDVLYSSHAGGIPVPWFVC
jgi:hypothetical protein